jgi:phage shock protein PspC (stress-responsive transcriptional regulator)
MREFRRAPDGHRWVGGVCTGLAYSLGVPAWVVRLVTFIACWAWGAGIVAYGLLWVFAPEWRKLPADFSARIGETGAEPPL